MINSKEIYDAIERIADEPSKIAKTLMLEWAIQNIQGFRAVLIYAYNPFLMYNLRNVLALMRSTEEGSDFSLDTYKLLDALSERLLTGGRALEAVRNHLMNLNGDSEELFRRILKKDLRGGFDVKTINNACKGLIPVASYMRCSLPKDVKMENFKYPAYSQEKADGLFVNITLVDDSLTMLSRTYQPMPIDKYSRLLDTNEMVDGYQYHGELLVEVGGKVVSRKISNGILNRVNKGGDFGPTEVPIFIAWDMVPVKDIKNGLCEIPYVERFLMLEETLPYDWQIIQTVVVYSYAEARIHFDALVKRGKEGSVLKDMQAIWKDGKSTQIVKLKQEHECELRIIDFVAGTGANEFTFGSLACTTECGELAVNVGNLTDALTFEINANKEDWRFAIIAVTYSTVIQDKKGRYSLFEPKFVERRYDLDEANYLSDLLTGDSK
jgi:DNA ligase-1